MQLTKLNNGNYQLAIELTPDIINGLLLNPLELTNEKPIDKFFGMQKKSRDFFIELFSIYKSNNININNEKVQELRYWYKIHDLGVLLRKLQQKGYCKLNIHNNRIVSFQLAL
jgi:hypothetical protein